MADNKKKVDNKSGLPNKQQLQTMLQRYSSIKMYSIDTEQESVSVSSDTAKFKKPIFFDTDCGKVSKKIMMTLKEQGFFPNSNGPHPSRIVLEGNLGLIQKTMNLHNDLLGDNPYEPNKPFDNDLLLLEGNRIPEHELNNRPYNESDELNSNDIDKQQKELK